MEDRTGYTLSEAAERYRQTLVFNNDLLKEEFPRRYEFNTEMAVARKVRFGANEQAIEKYRARRAAEYDKKYQVYCGRLDDQVEPSVRRYVANIKAAFGYGVE